MDAITPTRRWVEKVVIGLKLCPFAKQPLLAGRLYFASTSASDEAELLLDLAAELERLTRDDNIETSLLIHPFVLNDFAQYNRFLTLAEQLMKEYQLEGIYQIASFHPDYQFEGTQADAVENYTNRSPFPMLHLIRESRLAEAIASYPDVAEIPLRNIAKLKKLGLGKMIALRDSCFLPEEQPDPEKTAAPPDERL